MIEKGDLVIKRGRHAAKVYFVEDFDNESILLVNGVRDEYFEGEKDIERFHKSYRLLVKAEHLIEEEKRYWLQKIPVPLLDKEGEKKWLWKYTGTVPSNIFGVDTDKIDSKLYKAIFTESEIVEMDITGFKKIEVIE